MKQSNDVPGTYRRNFLAAQELPTGHRRVKILFKKKILLSRSFRKHETRPHKYKLSIKKKIHQNQLFGLLCLSDPKKCNFLFTICYITIDN